VRDAPKNPRLNAEFRKAILAKSFQNLDLQAAIWQRCSEDIVFWLDTFGFTYSPKDFPECPNRPFVLWPYQQDALLRMNAALGKHPMLIEKSRDMGATWLILALFLWRWQFRGGQSFLVGSRKQELVDKTGDPKSLFWKLIYLIDNQPPWMKPSYERNILALHNNENGSTIDGESTNDDFARGDRRTAILLDEFPAVDNGYAILKAVGDATACPIYAGTSQGA
jgi:phage terminase large subunit